MKKQGISLIVLVITIIVMIILAASVVITLSNSGIINKAGQAVTKTNIKEVEQLASLTWADEYMAGKRGVVLKTAVLDALDEYTDKYDIDVTDKGVTVTEKGSGSEDEEFILNKATGKFSEKVKSDYERLKIENFMREMNHSDDIDVKKFKEYKDFSSVPTDEEVVAAMRVLQKAGLGNFFDRNSIDYSMLTNNGIQQGSMLNLMGGAGMNPQLIQALLTNNMTQGF